jgi:hypothetical protein
LATEPRKLTETPKSVSDRLSSLFTRTSPAKVRVQKTSDFWDFCDRWPSHLLAPIAAGVWGRELKVGVLKRSGAKCGGLSSSDLGPQTAGQILGSGYWKAALRFGYARETALGSPDRSRPRLALLPSVARGKSAPSGSAPSSSGLCGKQTELL